MTSDFEAYWDDLLLQKMYSIYRQQRNGEPEFLGGVSGHDAGHAVHKFAQWEELDPATLTAERTWPTSNC